ncbi:MAG TPA: hypothetical protein DD417_10115 [Elusimicrobia bacterium]|nr:hypothetical protein [Elusimicrobiota bacterium]
MTGRSCGAGDGRASGAATGSASLREGRTLGRTDVPVRTGETTGMACCRTGATTGMTRIRRTSCAPASAGRRIARRAAQVFSLMPSG